VCVSAEIVNPELVGPRFLGGWFAVEKEDVGLDASATFQGSTGTFMFLKSRIALIAARTSGSVN